MPKINSRQKERAEDAFVTLINTIGYFPLQIESLGEQLIEWVINQPLEKTQEVDVAIKAASVLFPDVLGQLKSLRLRVTPQLLEAWKQGKKDAVCPPCRFCFTKMAASDKTCRHKNGVTFHDHCKVRTVQRMRIVEAIYMLPSLRMVIESQQILSV